MSFLIPRPYFLLLLIALSYSVVGNAQLSDWESGEIVIQETDTNYIKKLISKAEELSFSNPDSSLIASEKALELSERLGYDLGKAQSLKNIGIVSYYRSEFFIAEQHFQQSLEVFQKSGDILGISNLQSNIGSVYLSMGDDPKALDHFFESLRNAEIVDDPMRIGTAYVNIGTVYKNDELTYDPAIEYYQKSVPYFEEINYSMGLAAANVNLGELYLELEKPESSLPYLNDALDHFRELGFDPATPLNFIGAAYLKMEDFANAEEFYKQALASSVEKSTKFEEAEAYLGLGNVALQQQNPALAVSSFISGLEVAQNEGLLQQTRDAYLGLSEAYALQNDYQNAYETYQRLNAAEDSLRNNEHATVLSQLRSITHSRERTYENQKIQYELERSLEKEKEEQARLLLFIGLGVFVLISLGLLNRFMFIRKARNRIAEEKDRSDEILLNILPEETADELKKNGSIKAKQFNEITVLFTDFKGFSLIAEQLSPEQLVESVDYYFRYFDTIIEKYGLEKIKTIGDAYMCAAGIPRPSETHAEDALKAAIDMRDFVEKTKENPPKNIYPFEVRVGLNSGPVVAGVVGTKKFAYDIWGSTVNFAARMESKSEPGRINVSESTYNLLKDKYDFTYRGEVEVKNGQLLKMYFAEVEYEQIA
ncbi:adenylate/guanylate cyclase domain-containing protein [Robiginitalea sp. SC105]|uniref:adenylate/guanylate cyclase domain-containing protein n=1 Tax=Robiginitalea sp. SC105 TaxID=2762332 RepID=UPI00163A0D97|nr:adenylate/guanylate cyclase domain-containing protein [Robiginitalea sp. SC105]MBC2838873.1 tetratricopeptide repeat protein [Robiginitalea sp. SC105]